MEKLPERSLLWQFRDSCVQLDSCHLYVGKHAQALRAFPFTALRDWAVDEQEARFLFVDAESEPQEVCVRADKEELAELARAFNAYRAAAISPKHLQICTHCQAYIDISASEEAPIHYCPECHCLGDQGGKNWSVQGSYAYQFCANGYFSIVDKVAVIDSPQFVLGAVSLRERVLPILTRMAGLLLWVGLFALLLFATSSFIGRTGGLLLMGVIVLAVLVLGSHWSDLMMHGRLKPLIRPPSWERVAALLRRGKRDQVKQLLAQPDLSQHPGLQASCALACFRAGEQQEAWEHLQHALQRCGNHPFILRLACEYARDEERPGWEARLERVIAANRLQAS